MNITTITIKDIADRIDVWDEWKANYRHYVPLFINEAVNKRNWSDWDKDVFDEYFSRTKNCVSALQQGNFSKAEQQLIKNDWNVIGPLLKEIAQNQDAIRHDLYESLREELLKHTYRKMNAAVNRLIAGLQPKLLCTIVAPDHLNSFANLLKNGLHLNLGDYDNIDWCKNSNIILSLFRSALPTLSEFDLITYPWQTKEFLLETDLTILAMQIEIDKIVDLLSYKKQIILQGPPGTGKTKLALELAAELIDLPKEINDELSDEDIISSLRNAKIFRSVADGAEYELIDIIAESKHVRTRKSSGTIDTNTFSKIREWYKNNLWSTAVIDGTDDRRAAAIAKYIATNRPANTLEESEQFKLIQFHPAYTYEDFVRGIVAKPNESGEGIIYEAENKLLGKFAALAQKNLADSEGNRSKGKEGTFKSQLDAFITIVSDAIDNSGAYSLGSDTTAKIVGFLQGKGFIYSFENRPDIKYTLLFADLVKINEWPGKIEKSTDVRSAEEHLEMKGKYPYYYRAYNLIKNQQVEPTEFVGTETHLKNYVLVIDEVNRANLSSVLGELIYALEYRGKKVESMYAVEGRHELVLPPNLYIIGTMNTADRSVGHIDYAIRRRFAFVDVPPKDLSVEQGITFDRALFNKIADLFSTNLSGEFDIKDVQLGHSYFIDRSAQKGSMDIRLKYEIKPILREYVKDGILIGDKDGKTIAQYVESL